MRGPVYSALCDPGWPPLHNSCCATLFMLLDFQLCMILSRKVGRDEPGRCMNSDNDGCNFFIGNCSIGIYIDSG